jgi:plastocyanin
MKYGPIIFVLVFAISAAGLYGLNQMVRTEDTTAAADGEDGGATGGPTTLQVVARNLAFDKRTINASANQPVTVTFVNNDAGVVHNIAFYTTRAATTKIAVGNLITGVAQEDVAFTAPAAGNYYFRCDAHPDTMNGAFVVK